LPLGFRTLENSTNHCSLKYWTISENAITVSRDASSKGRLQPVITGILCFNKPEFQKFSTRNVKISRKVKNKFNKTKNEANLEIHIELAQRDYQKQCRYGAA
jgi:hypothetical protein